MRISLLNLISTPIPVLNSLGLNLRVGLSSEDPKLLRHPSESYQAFLTVYSPEGTLVERIHLGEVPPNRRRFFDVSSITRGHVPKADHLVVVHRVPSRLLSEVIDVDQQIEMKEEPDYSMFRSLVEYSFPNGGNGSVIYETPPRLNARTPGRPPSNTLTFTNKIVQSERVNTVVVLIHYSVNHEYSDICNYNFSVYSMAGSPVVSGQVSVGPFSIKLLDIGQLVPTTAINDAKDPQDGLATFTFVGYTDKASIPSLVVNATPELGGVSVEHTHPAQEYILPFDIERRQKVKLDARHSWMTNIISR